MHLKTCLRAFEAIEASPVEALPDCNSTPEFCFYKDGTTFYVKAFGRGAPLGQSKEWER